MVNRQFHVVSNHISARRFTQNTTSAATPDESSVKRLFKAYVLYPSLFSDGTPNPVGWCTIPQRLQSLTLVAFLIINIVLSGVHYRLFAGNLHWDSTETQLWRYLADRTGVLSIANLPLLWCFAMRNNVLLWLTGWSFETYNQFHRWVARIATAEAVVHSIGYTVEAFRGMLNLYSVTRTLLTAPSLDGGSAEYYADWLERYWWCGAIVSLTAFLLLILNLLLFRPLLLCVSSLVFPSILSERRRTRSSSLCTLPLR